MSDVEPSFFEFDAAPLTSSAAEAERAAKRLACLQTLCLALTAATTFTQAADVVMSEGLGALDAAAGSLYLLDSEAAPPAAPEDTAFARVRALTPSFPTVETPARFTLASQTLIAEAIRQRSPRFQESAAETEACLPPSESLSAAEAVTASFAMGARAVLPLLVDSHCLGGLELTWEQERVFDFPTRAFMQVIAQLCAQTLERVRLYETERNARHEAERANERTVRLQTVTSRLSQALSSSQVAAIIMAEGAAALHAHRGVLALLTPDGAQLEIVQAQGYAPEIVQVWQQFALDAPIPLAHSVRTQQAVWLHDLAERDARFPQLARNQTPSQAYVVLPLFIQERIQGAISFGFADAQRFDAPERAFVTAIAEQCAQALERARLHDEAAQHFASLETLNARLQRAMAETHHRVKNNLQVISALVELQIDPRSPFVPVEALKRIGGHARALATLHDLLTDQAKTTMEITTISARALLGKMLPMLQATTGGHPLHSRIDDARLPVRMGAALCLVVNELVSNAVKHGGRSISLSLSVLPERREESVEEARPPIIRFEVDDDGPGFPPNFDPQIAAHTGLDLVENISRLDLGGKAAYSNKPEGGARVTITFPLPNT